MGSKIVLIGGFSEIIELCQELHYQEIAVIDRADVGRGTVYLGTDASIQESINEILDAGFCITPDLPNIREKIHLFYSKYNVTYPSLISRNARVSHNAQIARGAVIQYGSFVSSDVVIGAFVKLNVNACVMHDSVIGDFSTLAPSCNILGRVVIGSNCYIGTSAIIMPGVTLCNDVIVGAGAVVTKSITIPGVYIGIPAVKIK